jgi:LysM repeat protein
MPTSVRAKKLGFPMLADLQMLGLEYQHTSIATSRALLKSKPELARDFMRAYVEGIHYAKTHRRESIEIIAKYLRTDDKEVLDDTYDSIIQTLVPEKPYPTLKGIQIILREFGAKDPAARSARPEQFVDTTILKELESSGFIDKLYKSAAVAKAAPRTESVPAAAPTKGNVQVADAKTKAVATEEKAKPVAKLVPATAEPATAVQTKKVAQEYIVKSGDTLSKIADQLYGNGAKWERVYEANRDTLKNPNYIFVGQKLNIPADG